MDMEQLKLILETVSSVSGDAAAIAIGYILLDTLVPFFGLMIALLFFYKVVKLITKCYSEIEFFKEMRDLLGIGSSGVLTDLEKGKTKAKIKEIVAIHLSKK